MAKSSSTGSCIKEGWTYFHLLTNHSTQKKKIHIYWEISIPIFLVILKVLHPIPIKRGYSCCNEFSSFAIKFKWGLKKKTYDDIYASVLCTTALSYEAVPEIFFRLSPNSFQKDQLSGIFEIKLMISGLDDLVPFG